MKKHTTGPWIVGKGAYECRNIYAATPATDDDGFEFHPCIATVEDNDVDCWDANLMLIAAAPDLLEAAIKVNALSIQTDAHKELRAAIAKATGRVVDAAPECTCAAKDMTFGRCCKLTPNKCKWCGHDIHAHDKQYGCAEDGCDCETPNAKLTGLAPREDSK